MLDNEFTHQNVVVTKEPIMYGGLGSTVKVPTTADTVAEARTAYEPGGTKGIWKDEKRYVYQLVGVIEYKAPATPPEVITFTKVN